MKNLNPNSTLSLDNYSSRDKEALIQFFSILLEWANKEKSKENKKQQALSIDSLIQ